MSILENAINSIVIGVEDYNLAVDGDEKRYISSTRNLFAGILLLFKHKLSVLSPADSDEVLIKQKIMPSLNDLNNLSWKGKGGKTVDVSQIRERFRSLNINVDWKRITGINDYRNNIEHYYSKESGESVKKMISDCFLIIQSFINTELELDAKELLGDKVWTELISINEVYESEKDDCNKKLEEEFEWVSTLAFETVSGYYCNDCFSDLISINNNGNIYCKTCEKEFDNDKFIEEAFENEYGCTLMEIQQGGEPSLILCPNCDTNTYTRLENICHICAESQILECGRCGLEIPFEELDGSGICGYCQHMSSK